MPFGPALPNGVRTPSTKTTSRAVRGTGPPPGAGYLRPECYSPVTISGTGACCDLAHERALGWWPTLPGSLIGQRRGEGVHSEVDLPRTGAVRAQRVGDRGDAERLRRRPGQPTDAVRGEQVLGGQGVFGGQRRHLLPGAGQACGGGRVAVGPAVGWWRPVAAAGRRGQRGVRQVAGPLQRRQPDAGEPAGGP